MRRKPKKTYPHAKDKSPYIPPPPIPPTCSICRRPIDQVGDWTHGHNAQPLNDGRCCSACNADVVIPVRIFRMVRTFDKGSSK